MKTQDELFRINPPERLIRTTIGQPTTIDIKKRTIENVVTTKLLARDGGIVIPEGIITRFFVENPVVCALHCRAVESRSPVVGRSLGLVKYALGMSSTTQFADTELGREYAYLYGINEAAEVYMRAFSFGWSTLDVQYWTLDQAKQYLASDWDEEILSVWDKRMNEVWVATRSEMHEYSVVPVGADRESLSRAFGENIRVAGELITSLDLQEATTEITTLRNKQQLTERKLSDLEKKIQALSRDGSAAAERGDSAAFLEEVRSLSRHIKENYGPGN